MTFYGLLEGNPQVVSLFITCRTGKKICFLSRPSVWGYGPYPTPWRARDKPNRDPAKKKNQSPRIKTLRRKALESLQSTPEVCEFRTQHKSQTKRYLNCSMKENLPQIRRPLLAGGRAVAVHWLYIYIYIGIYLSFCVTRDAQLSGKQMCNMVRWRCAERRWGVDNRDGGVRSSS